MEKGGGGASNSGVLRVSDRKPSLNGDGSAKLQIGAETFPSLVCRRPEKNPQHLLSGGGSGGDNEAAAGDIFCDDFSISGDGGESFARSTNSQLFYLSSTNPYESPGGMVEDVRGNPFTFAQWKELERQAMIYKYMVSSVPVPQHLLFSLSTGDSSSYPTHNGRHSKNGDQQPWRCKRTDGKKWRCSRDVAPHQKYCERHLHRGRPRSRKHVEVKTRDDEYHKKTTSLPSVVQPSSSTAANDLILLSNTRNDLSIYTPHKEINKNLSLLESEIVAGIDTGLPWLGSMENEGFPFSTSTDYMQSLDVFSYPNFCAPLPTGFIDAWSMDRTVDSCIALNEGDHSPSLNLTMAMAAGNVFDEDVGGIEMGLAMDSALLSPVGWEAFAGGGPLGEALTLLPESSPASPMTTLATTVSSPSGVLHRTLFSQSDNSVCNSPTLAAPPSSEAASINWFC